LNRGPSLQRARWLAATLRGCEFDFCAVEHRETHSLIKLSKSLAGTLRG